MKQIYRFLKKKQFISLGNQLCTKRRCPQSETLPKHKCENLERLFHRYIAILCTYKAGHENAQP